MSPDELARELEDLQRFAFPVGDPIALLEHDTRIADLEQENEELKQLAGARASQLATLSLDLDRLKAQLAQVQATRDTLQCQVELHDTDLRLRQQSFSRAALKERSEKRAQYLQAAYWISVALAALALAFTAVWIGQKYWSYTHDDHLRMLEQATAERVKATALLNEARQTFDRAARLQKQNRRPKPTTARAAKPAADDQNGTPGEAK